MIRLGTNEGPVAHKSLRDGDICDVSLVKIIGWWPLLTRSWGSVELLLRYAIIILKIFVQIYNKTL